MNNSQPSPKPQPPALNQINWLWAGGALLSSLSVLFLYRELQLGPEWLLSIAALLLGALSFLRIPRFLPLLAPLGLIANLCVATAWWYVHPDAGSLFFGVACSCGAAVLSLLLTREPIASLRSQQELVEQHRGAQWYAAGLSSMAVSWVAYLNMLTFGSTPFAEAAGPRRMALTLAWLVAGLIAVAIAHKRHHRWLKHLGFLFTGVAFVKALLYDTVHLSSFWRVGVLAVAGAMLMGVALFLQRSQRAEIAAAAEEA